MTPSGAKQSDATPNGAKRNGATPNGGSMNAAKPSVRPMVGPMPKPCVSPPSMPRMIAKNTQPARSSKIAAAMITYCSKVKVPLPRNGEKSLRVVGEQLTLVVQVHAEQTKMFAVDKAEG